ncbi:MAG TPA: tetratricopeptide repeat protein [Candidatus Acidoferrum sp.]|nr:tetratricopeptide repeat protein [Candidatus Acidoferrum sp.]
MKPRLTHSSDRWLVFGVCLFLAAIVWLVFGQAVHYEFVNFDDNAYVYENSAVTAGLTFEGVVAALHSGGPNTWDWVPLTAISHMADCQWFGLNAGGHHLTNILLHAATAILLFLVLRRMTGAIWRSAFVAAVFAVHPLRVESVVWVTERKDVLSGLFFMLTLWAYLGYVRKSRSFLRYLAVMLFFALGLLSKPMLVTLPVVLLLLDYWPLNRFPPRSPDSGVEPVPWLKNFSVPARLVVEKIPLLMLAAASGFLTVAALGHNAWSVGEYSLAMRMGNALVSYVAYLWLMLYPARLAVFYPYPAGGWPLGDVIPAFVLLAAISLGVFLGRRTRPYLLTGWLWYSGMMVPVIGLFEAGGQARADRFTYLPQIGLYLLLTWAAADGCARWRHRRAVLGGVAAPLLLALILCARAQTANWQNSESLWTHALACTSGNAPAENNLGEALLRQGRDAEAMVHLQQALQINPRYAQAHYNLGNLSHRLGRDDEAMVHFRAALQINPRYSEAHDNLGCVLFSHGQVDEAMVHFQQALQSDPRNADAHYNLSCALLFMGRLDEAVVEAQRALQINPGNANSHVNLGNALLQMGRDDEAIVHYHRALQINPSSLEVQNNLAWVLATASSAGLRDGRQAVDLAERANQTAGGENPIFLHTLAAAYAEAGRFDDAVRTAQRAMVLAQTAGQSGLAGRLNDELKLYAANRPFHQGSK